MPDMPSLGNERLDAMAALIAAAVRCLRAGIPRNTLVAVVAQANEEEDGRG